MGFLSGLAMAAIGPLIGGVLGGASSAYGASQQNQAAQAATERQMAFQRESAGIQMKFQERMTATSYQRAMDDMRKAGLNPILAYRQGGAGTPAGSSPGGSTYSPVSVGGAGVSGAAAGTSSAVAARRLGLETRRTMAEIDKLYTSAEKDSADADLATHQRMNAQEQRKLLKQQRLMNEPSVSSAKHAEKLYDSPMGEFFKYWQMLKRR